MNDKIINQYDQPTNACAQFSYRGYLISFNTIFKIPYPVSVWVEDEYLDEFLTVEQAIYYINSDKV